MLKDVRIRAGRGNFYDDTVEIGILTGRGDDKKYVHSLNFVPLGKDGSFKPCCTLDAKHAQHLIDALWNCGLRPTEGTGSAGAMAATQKHLVATESHLGDMRKMAFEMFGNLTENNKQLTAACEKLSSISRLRYLLIVMGLKTRKDVNYDIFRAGQ